MFESSVDIAAICCAVVCVGLLKSWHTKRNKRPAPPGPKGLPLVGNLFDMPEREEWLAVHKWEKEYGPVVYVKMLGTSFVFLNTYDAAVDLLEKRGSNFSSRPSNTMMELEGWPETLPVAMPYGEELKRARLYLHRFLQPGALDDYKELQARSIHKVLEGLLKTPGNYLDLVRHSAGETILMMTYGHKVAEQNDIFMEIGGRAVVAFAEAEGFFLVNLFPLLKYLPSWFPGAGFKKRAKEGYQAAMDMLQRPHETVKKRLLDGTAVPSMSSRLMETNTGTDGVVRDEELIAKTTSVTYGGGLDTTVSALLTFCLAMVLYPDVQRRAQDELDRVVGKNNLPTFEDRQNLPYVDAICKECLRWQPVLPFGLPHTAAEDDEYNGYHIPAGATLLPNVWAMTRDPDEYYKPDEFIPERWLPEDGKKLPRDISKMAFGFGRRICPGRHFAANSIFLGIASILSAFNISKALDEDGKPITPDVKYQSRFLRLAEPFPYSINPRSEEIVKAIHQAVESAK